MSVRHVGGEGFFNPSARRLYKDCLRLVYHVAEDHKNVNPNQVKAIVKQQFLMNAVVTDHKKLEDLKNAAMRALTNYVMHLSQKKDDWTAKPAANIFEDENK